MGEGIVEGQVTKVGREEGGESGAADHIGDSSRHDHYEGAQRLGTLLDYQRLNRMFGLLSVEYSDILASRKHRETIFGNIFASKAS